jgi:hypothetical protein
MTDLPPIREREGIAAKAPSPGLTEREVDLRIAKALRLVGTVMPTALGENAMVVVAEDLEREDPPAEEAGREKCEHQYEVWHYHGQRCIKCEAIHPELVAFNMRHGVTAAPAEEPRGSTEAEEDGMARVMALFWKLKAAGLTEEELRAKLEELSSDETAPPAEAKDDPRKDTEPQVIGKRRTKKPDPHEGIEPEQRQEFAEEAEPKCKYWSAVQKKCILAAPEPEPIEVGQVWQRNDGGACYCITHRGEERVTGQALLPNPIRTYQHTYEGWRSQCTRLPGVYRDAHW